MVNEGNEGVVSQCCGGGGEWPCIAMEERDVVWVWCGHIHGKGCGQ